MRRKAAAELGMKQRTTKQKKVEIGLLEDIEIALPDWSVFHEKGILAYAGGWRDQPVEWRETMLNLEAIYNEELSNLARTNQG